MTGWRVAIRTDASLTIGTGHVMRCLTLAEALRTSGAEVEVVSRSLAGDLTAAVAARGFRVHRLPRPDAPAPVDPSGPRHASWLEVDWRLDAAQTTAALSSAERAVDWLVVDHYAIEQRWEHHQRRFAGRILAIDDLADRPHDCELLLDQNYTRDEARYAALVPTACRTLLGPGYALLRDEFRRARANLRERAGACQRILIFFGGVDASNESAKALSAIERSPWRETPTDLVVGGGNPHRPALEALVGRLPNATLLVQAANMAELMARADLALGAAGSTTWERCCLGLPSIAVATAENQVPTLRDLASDGYVIDLGDRGEVSVDDIARALEVGRDAKLLRRLAERSLSLVDGRGVERVLDAMAGAG